MVSKAARRYASALFQTAVEKEILDKVLSDARMIQNTIEGSRELKLFLKSPMIKPEEKRRALDTIFSDKVTPLTLRFFELATSKARSELIGQIMTGFIDLYKEKAGIIDVDVYTAAPLPDQQRTDLVHSLENMTRKKVDLNYFEESELIGGLALQIDDTVIDGTVKHKISRLKTLFKEASV